MSLIFVYFEAALSRSILTFSWELPSKNFTIVHLFIDVDVIIIIIRWWDQSERTLWSLKGLKRAAGGSAERKKGAIDNRERVIKR